MSRKQLSKDVIIEATLLLIEEKGNSGKVNFREIGRSLGCAHTSLYNFFPSYNELLYTAAQTLMTRMRDSLQSEALERIKKGTYDSMILAYINSVVLYALNHKGWYSFLWFEYAEIDLTSLFENQPRPEKLLLPIYLQEYKHPISNADATMKLQVCHGFVHGELSKFLSGRSAYTSENELIESIMRHVKWLLDL